MCISVKCVEYLVDWCSQWGPEMEVQTADVISACDDCHTYYDQVMNRIDNLQMELNLQTKTIDAPDIGHELDMGANTDY